MEPTENRIHKGIKITGDLKKVEIEHILNTGKVCRVAFVDENEPYILPLFYGYDGKCLYIHSSRRGKKLEILRKNRRVCFQISADVEIVENKVPCRWYAKYRSVIGWGDASLIEDAEEKREALMRITERYYRDPFPEFSIEELERLVIIKIRIDRITGKTRM